MTAVLLLISLLLLLANGFFVAAEFAIVAARSGRLQQRAEDGDRRAATALKSARELSLMLSGAQLGITMASLGLGFVAEPAVAHLIDTGIESVVELPSGVLHSISFVVALAIVTFLHMVISEMAPKNIAIADPEKTALWIAFPFRVYINIFRPLIRFFNLLGNAGTRVFGVEPPDERSDVRTGPEMRAIINESAREGMIKEFEHRLLSGAIGFSQRDAASVMIPRTDVTAIASSATPAEIERIVLETGHSS